MAFDVRSSAAGEHGQLRLMSAAIEFDDTTVELGALAAGDVVVQAWADVETAFNAATTNTLSLGDGTTAGKYLDGVAAGAAGVVPAGGAGPFANEDAAGTLTATYTQTGTAATAGRARLYALVTDTPK